MSVLIFTENWEGNFKKLSYEIVSYGAELASQLGTKAIAVTIGEVSEETLKSLGKYGASKVIQVVDDRLKNLVNKPYSSVLAQIAEKESSNVLVFANNATGKALAPRLSVRLKAGLAAGVSGLPKSLNPFITSKRSFNGNAYASVEIKTPVKIVSLLQNSFGIFEKNIESEIEKFNPVLNDGEFVTKVKEVNKITGKIILTDAEVVVSAGRGMKGPENWASIEELASILGAATACSRPVSDEGWRPHDEHVGQTGKIIAPDLYFAIGISGAIQHMGGVSGSKCIVAINRDKDAPIFEFADYGIVGDAFKVLPELITAVKEVKAS